MNWIKELLNKIYNWFKSQFISELPESVQETIDDQDYIDLYFYSAMPSGWNIKNVNMLIGNETIHIDFIPKDDPIKITITDLNISEITATLDCVCDDGEVMNLKNIRFAGKDFFVNNAKIVYKITDVGLGLVPITFGGAVVEQESVIKPIYV